MKKSISVVLSMVILAMTVCALLPVQALAEEDKPILYGDNESYSGSGLENNETEYINFHHKTVEEAKISYGMPNFFETEPRVNTCANIAGATVVGYYNRIYDELIPGFTAGRYIRGVYFYNSQTSVIQTSVINPLYDSMKTATEGTTSANFRSGLQYYIEGKGRHISYTAQVINGNFDYAAYKASINSEIPVVVFTASYNLVALGDFTNTATQDVIYKALYSGNHVFVGYGYKTVSYYDSNNVLIKQTNFLNVAAGKGDIGLCYLMISDRTNVREAYKAYVY